MAKKTNIPEDLDFDKLAQGPAIEPEAEETATESKSAYREYKPSEKTLEILNKMPKEALKARYGIDIDKLIKTEKRRGLLEALAYGDQTPRPLDIRIHVPGAGVIETPATFCLKYAFYGKDNEPVIFMDNIHKTRLEYDVDENGVIKRDKNGEQKKVYFRNPIKEGTIIKWNGKELSREQTDRLRLTGHLGEAVTGPGKKNELIPVLLSVDPFNNQELVAVDANYVAKTLTANPEFKLNGPDGDTLTIPLTAYQIRELARGKNVWIGDKGDGSQCNVQYNAATRKLEKTVDFDYAQRQERDVKEKERLAREIAKNNAENIKVGNHL